MNAENNLSTNPETANFVDMQSTYQMWMLKNLADTFSLGKVLSQMASNMKILLIKGSMGVGKTTLVKAIGANLKIIEPITSPTFALAQHYPNADPPLIHLDLYRLEDPKSADELFLQEEEESKNMNALMIIEWPERLGVALPEAWEMQLRMTSEGYRSAQLRSPAGGVSKKAFTSS